jgi:hypothetical protein
MCRCSRRASSAIRDYRFDGKTDGTERGFFEPAEGRDAQHVTGHRRHESNRDQYQVIDADGDDRESPRHRRRDARVRERDGSTLIVRRERDLVASPIRAGSIDVPGGPLFGARAVQTADAGLTAQRIRQGAAQAARLPLHTWRWPTWRGEPARRRAATSPDHKGADEGTATTGRQRRLTPLRRPPGLGPTPVAYD